MPTNWQRASRRINVQRSTSMRIARRGSACLFLVPSYPAQSPLYFLRLKQLSTFFRPKVCAGPRSLPRCAPGRGGCMIRAALWAFRITAPLHPAGYSYASCRSSSLPSTRPAGLRPRPTSALTAAAADARPSLRRRGSPVRNTPPCPGPRRQPPPAGSGSGASDRPVIGFYARQWRCCRVSRPNITERTRWSGPHFDRTHGATMRA